MTGDDALPQLQGKRVLIVDDNPTNRRILTLQLHKWGIQTSDTESPRQALEWLEHGQTFDLAILDMQMPEMDGVTLGSEIRKLRQAQSLPLLLFTSLGRRVSDGSTMNFAATLSKPIKTSQLFDALANVFGLQPANRPRALLAKAQLDPEMAKRYPLRILLAEDNTVNQKLALRLLQKLGYRADVASNGMEAVQSVERQSYDVILMDVQMPEMDGLEASRLICAQWPRERRPRIIATTANAMQGDREMCLAAGMDDYISKPIRVAELIAALTKVPPLITPKEEIADLPPIVDRPTFEDLKKEMGARFHPRTGRRLLRRNATAHFHTAPGIGQPGYRGISSRCAFHQVNQQHPWRTAIRKPGQRTRNVGQSRPTGCCCRGSGTPGS